MELTDGRTVLPIAAWSGDDAVAMLAERAERWRIRCEVATRRAEMAEQERDFLSDLAADATARLFAAKTDASHRVSGRMSRPSAKD